MVRICGAWSFSIGGVTRLFDARIVQRSDLLMSKVAIGSSMAFKKPVFMLLFVSP
jgi:hypothetical protein